MLRKTMEIPYGEVRPYSWVAREIGRPRAVRAVGSALAGAAPGSACLGMLKRFDYPSLMAFSA